MFNAFNHETKTIGAAGLILAFFSFLSAVLGLLRNSLLASHFGAGADLDIYYAAFRVPDFIYNILIAGSISAAFIPLFNKYLNQSKEEAWRFTNNILTLLLIILGVAALFLAVFAPFFVKFIVPGFSAEQVSKVAGLTRLLMLQPILLGVSSLIAGCLQSFKRFFINATAPVLYNLGIILGIVVLTPLLGIKGVIFGVIFGAFLHFLVQFLCLKNLGFKFQFLPAFKSAAARDMFFLMLPRVFSLLSSEITSFAIVIFASTMAVGSLAVFNFASSLMAFPAVIFGVSFAVAAFPALSRVKDNKSEFINIVKKTAKKIIYFLLPAVLLYIVFRKPIVGLVFGYGKFGIASQSLTSDVLLIFSFGILAHGLLPFMVRIFFSMENTKIPLLTGLLSSIVSIAIAAVFARQIGPAGLALAVVCGNWLNLLALFLIFMRKVRNWN